MFLIAYSKQLNVNVNFPKPTHWANVPIGYSNSRRVALKTLNFDSFTEPDHYYIAIEEPSRSLKPALTAFDAINDLPIITEHLSGGLKRGARRFDSITYYEKNKKLNSYAKLMRKWPGFENKAGIKDHVIRSLPRDYKIFAEMKPGDQYPEAFKVANLLFHRKLEELSMKGMFLDEKSKTYQELEKEFIPPYDAGKFPNKWRKMEAHMPARTLMAHLGKDSYSHIHYDSSQARTISVREAARLQSFPDGFTFSGTMNPAFKQIGNSVPPLMAKAIAEVMYLSLKDSLNVKKISRQKIDSF